MGSLPVVPGHRPHAQEQSPLRSAPYFGLNAEKHLLTYQFFTFGVQDILEPYPGETPLPQTAYLSPHMG